MALYWWRMHAGYVLQTCYYAMLHGVYDVSALPCAAASPCPASAAAATLRFSLLDDPAHIATRQTLNYLAQSPGRMQHAPSFHLPKPSLKEGVLDTAPDPGALALLPLVSPELLLVLVRMLWLSSGSGVCVSLLLSDPSAESESPCLANGSPSLIPEPEPMATVATIPLWMTRAGSGLLWRGLRYGRPL